MTGLLISVRDAVEADTALDGGADLLDVKEPKRGSLGAASPEIWRQVLAVCRDRVLTSAALGELHEAESQLDLETLASFHYAKIGLAGCANQSDWQERWTNILGILPRPVTPVAVVYADWQNCDAPEPQKIIRQALGARCGVVLFDTYVKSDGNLFTHIAPKQLHRMIAAIRGNGLRVVLGGSLRGTSIVQALDLKPDYIAVRAAACCDRRTGPVDLQRVRELSALVGNETFLRRATSVERNSTP